MRVTSDTPSNYAVRALALFVVTVFVITVATWSHPPKPRAPSTSGPLLSQRLWSLRDANDSTHALMVPLHAAFSTGDTETIDQYAALFERFRTDHQDLAPGTLDRLHFLYFYSRFTVLREAQLGCTDEIRSHYSANLRLWREIADAPAWQWEHSDFDNVFERVRWKLAQTSTTLSYYGSVVDEDLFVLAIGADLHRIAEGCGSSIDDDTQKSVDLADAIFSREYEESTPSVWNFQAGEWADHPDFLYAGRYRVSPGLTPAPIDSISPDSSHSMRLPLFLRSFACAAPADSPSRTRYTALIERLGQQWKTRVLVMPELSFPALRMTNFMGGENGVYRYGHATQGTDGYGPFELSGSLNLGWWSFLGKPAERPYSVQLRSLPFTPTVIATYTGPNTTRDRNPAFREPHFYEGDLIRDILKDALIVASDADLCHDR